MIPASHVVVVPRNLNGRVSVFNTVRDVVEYVSGSDSTVLKNHIDYDAFGRILAQSDSTIVTVAYYTGRYRDLVTGLQYNRARWYDAHTGRWLSEDPIGFEGGDGNLYRYVQHQVLWAVDPWGHQLKWTQSLVDKPKLHGSTGFSMQVRQVLSTGGLHAKPGTQTWQTNDVKFLALIYTDNKCAWDDKHRQRLDVNSPKGAPPYSWIDTIITEYDAGTADVCFLFVSIERELGFRPYTVNRKTGAIRFSSKRLRLGNNYDATQAQWKLATKDMQEPILDSSVSYVFFDKVTSRRCCSKQKHQQAESFFKTIWDGELGTTIGSAAVLSYKELGRWWAMWGHESTM